MSDVFKAIPPNDYVCCICGRTVKKTIDFSRVRGRPAASRTIGALLIEPRGLALARYPFCGYCWQAAIETARGLLPRNIRLEVERDAIVNVALGMIQIAGAKPLAPSGEKPL